MRSVTEDLDYTEAATPRDVTSRDATPRGTPRDAASVHTATEKTYSDDYESDSRSAASDSYDSRRDDDDDDRSRDYSRSPRDYSDKSDYSTSSRTLSASGRDQPGGDGAPKTAPTSAAAPLSEKTPKKDS